MPIVLQSGLLRLLGLPNIHWNSRYSAVSTRDRSLNTFGQVELMSKAFTDGLTHCLFCSYCLAWQEAFWGLSIQIGCFLKWGRRGERDGISQQGSSTPWVHTRCDSSCEKLSPHNGWRISCLMNESSPNHSVSVYWASTCARHVGHIWLPSVLYHFHINEQNGCSIPKRTVAFSQSGQSSLEIFLALSCLTILHQFHGTLSVFLCFDISSTHLMIEIVPQDSFERTFTLAFPFPRGLFNCEFSYGF